MPIILATAVLSSLKKAAPWIAGALAVGGAYGLHKISRYRQNKALQNTDLDLKKAKEINDLFLSCLSSIDNNFDDDDGKARALMAEMEENLIDITNEKNVQVPTYNRVVQETGLKDSSPNDTNTDYKETIAQAFSNYLIGRKDLKNQGKYDKETVIMVIAGNICKTYVDEIDELSQTPGKESKDLLKKAITSLSDFLSNMINKNGLIDKKLLFGSSQRKITMETLKDIVKEWGEQRIESQEYLSSRVYFDENKKDIRKEYTSLADFLLRTTIAGDVLKQKKEKLTLVQIKNKTAFAEGVNKELKTQTNLEPVIPHSAVMYLLNLDNDVKKNPNSALKNYSKKISKLSKNLSNKNTSTLKFLLEQEGKYLKKHISKHPKWKKELLEIIHEVHSQALLLNVLLAEYTSSLEKFGTDAGLRAGTFEFKHLILKQTVNEYGKSLKKLLTHPYYKALNKKLSLEKNKNDTVVRQDSKLKNELKTKEMDGLFPENGASSSNIFPAGVRLLKDWVGFENLLGETWEVVKTKKEQQENNASEDSDIIRLDAQLPYIDNYIVNTAFCIHHAKMRGTQKNISKLAEKENNLNTVETNNAQTCIDSLNEISTALEQVYDHEKKFLEPFKISPLERNGNEHKIRLESWDKFFKIFENKNKSSRFLKITMDYKKRGEKHNSTVMMSKSEYYYIDIDFESIATIEDLQILQDEIDKILKAYNENYNINQNETKKPPFYKKLVNLRESTEKTLVLMESKEIRNNAENEFLQELEKTNKELNEIQKSFKLEATKNKIELVGKNYRISSVENENKQLKIEHKEKERKQQKLIDNINKDKEELQITINDLKELNIKKQSYVDIHIKEELETINSLIKKMNNLGNKADNLMEKFIDKNSNKKENTDATIDATSQAFGNITIFLSEVKETSKTCSRMLSQLKNFAKKFDRKYKEKFKETEQTINKADDIISRMNGYISTLLKKIKTLTKELKEAKEKAKIKEIELNEMQDKYENQTDELNSKNSKIQHLQNEFEKISSQLSEIQNSHANQQILKADNNEDQENVLQEKPQNSHKRDGNDNELLTEQNESISIKNTVQIESQNFDTIVNRYKSNSWVYFFLAIFLSRYRSPAIRQLHNLIMTNNESSQSTKNNVDTEVISKDEVIEAIQSDIKHSYRIRLFHTACNSPSTMSEDDYSTNTDKTIIRLGRTFASNNE